MPRFAIQETSTSHRAEDGEFFTSPVYRVTYNDETVVDLDRSVDAARLVARARNVLKGLAHETDASRRPTWRERLARPIYRFGKAISRLLDKWWWGAPPLFGLLPTALFAWAAWVVAWVSQPRSVTLPVLGQWALGGLLAFALPALIVALAVYWVVTNGAPPDQPEVLVLRPDEFAQRVRRSGWSVVKGPYRLIRRLLVVRLSEHTAALVAEVTVIDAERRLVESVRMGDELLIELGDGVAATSLVLRALTWISEREDRERRGPIRAAREAQPPQPEKP